MDDEDGDFDLGDLGALNTEQGSTLINGERGYKQGSTLIKGERGYKQGFTVRKRSVYYHLM